MTTRPWDVPEHRERYLYNPGPAFRYDFSNETFSFPAHDGYWVDPITKQQWHEPGVMPVRPHKFEHEWDERYRDQYGKPMYSPKKHTDEEIIRYFIGEDYESGHLGKTRGVRELSPSWAKNEEYDAQVKEAARLAFLRNRYDQAQKNIERFKASNTKAASENRPTEAANELLLKDFAFVAEYQSLVNSALPKHECPECRNRFVELTGPGSLEAHINALHPYAASELLVQVGLVKEKKRAGRPRKPQPAAA